MPRSGSVGAVIKCSVVCLVEDAGMQMAAARLEASRKKKEKITGCDTGSRDACRGCRTKRTDAVSVFVLWLALSYGSSVEGSDRKSVV